MYSNPGEHQEKLQTEGDDNSRPRAPPETRNVAVVKAKSWIMLASGGTSVHRPRGWWIQPQVLKAQMCPMQKLNLKNTSIHPLLYCLSFERGGGSQSQLTGCERSGNFKNTWMDTWGANAESKQPPIWAIVYIYEWLKKNSILRWYWYIYLLILLNWEKVETAFLADTWNNNVRTNAALCVCF